MPPPYCSAAVRCHHSQPAHPVRDRRPSRCRAVLPPDSTGSSPSPTVPTPSSKVSNRTTSGSARSRLREARLNRNRQSLTVDRRRSCSSSAADAGGVRLAQRTGLRLGKEEEARMKLRMIAATAALVACVAVSTSAAARATFILTNGGRASGELVFHGGQGNNMIDNQLNLADNGREQSYPLDSVAVIDLAGGAPSQDELSKTLGKPQAMALRNGFVQGGQFVNIQNGTTLVWRNEAGDVQRYEIGRASCRERV